MDTSRSPFHGSLHPEPETASLDGFRIDEPVEIRALLRRLCSGAELMALFSEGPSFVVSRLLSVESASLAFEIGQEMPLAQLRAARELVCVAFLDSVKVQFRAPVLGEEGLRLALPRRVYRMQRREGYRVKPAAGEAVWCLFRARGAEQHPVLDLSVVGLALSLPAHEEPPLVGTLLEDAKLRLPGPRLLTCALRVRRVNPLSPGRGHRLGCSFERLSLEASRVLQKLVMDIERAGRKR